MDSIKNKFKTFVCMDSVLTAAALYVLLRWVPGPAAVARALPIPGGGFNVTVGEVVVASLIASAAVKPLSKNLCQ